MEIGRTATCMAKESALATMEINMKENIRMIINMYKYLIFILLNY